MIAVLAPRTPGRSATAGRRSGGPGARVACAVLLLGALFAPGTRPAAAQNNQTGEMVEWRHYAADRASTKYSPADQINGSNVAELEIAWRWTTPDGSVDAQALRGDFKGTPLMVDGTLYSVSALNLVSAVNPSTGEELWSYDPRAYERGTPTHGGFTMRGIEFWEHRGMQRIVLVTGTHQLVSLDAGTGEPDLEFGEAGMVDMSGDIARPDQLGLTGASSPAVVCGDTIMMGAVIADFGLTNEMPAGNIRGYDIRTGQRKWVFHTVPQGDEPGAETWHDESWRYSGSSNVWSWMSCDEETGWVYFGTGTPNSDYYGGHRHGDNLYAESLVALDAATGEKKWHFQAVRHGLWDYDFPCAPILLDIVVDGKPIKAVAQVSKQAFTYVFDRRTGEPVWPIPNRKVPESTAPGEWTASEQPFPSKPPAFDRQGLRESDLIDFTPELHEKALQIYRGTLRGGPMFTPPIVEGEYGRKAMGQLPGQAGGANWGGAAADPDSGMLFVPSQTRVGLMGLRPPTERQQSDRNYLPAFTFVSGPQGLPLVKPPWARLTAIDLNRGEIVWQVPVGDGPRDHPALADLDLGQLGAFPLAGLTPGWPLLTRTLVFVVTAEQEPGHYGRRGPSTGFVYAFDKATGEEIWRTELPATPGGSPMTYMVDGRQFLVVPVGGRGQDHDLVAYALPEE